MKWSVQQLQKIQKFPFKFSEVIDFTSYANDVQDIIEIKDVKVEGCINRINDVTFEFTYSIDAPLILQCALTLEPVEYTVKASYDEVYSLENNDDYFLIEKNTINLDEMVWSNILIEKPINVTLPNAYEILKERGISLNEEPDFDEDEEILFYSSGEEEEEN